MMRPYENTTSSAVNGEPSWNLTFLRSVEAPLRRRDLLPGGREAGLDLEVLVEAHQALVDVLHDAVRGGVVLRVRVEREDVVLRRPLERDGVRGGAGQGGGGAAGRPGIV